MKAKIKIERKDGMTILSNDRGDQWTCLGNMPELYSLSALVTFTLQRAFEKAKLFSDDFEIEMEVEHKLRNRGKKEK